MNVVQAAAGVGSDEYCMAIGKELQQQGNPLRFRRHIQSEHRHTHSRPGASGTDAECDQPPNIRSYLPSIYD